MGARFQLLGEVGVTMAGEPVPIKHARVRCVLAALLVDANRTVSADALVERVWSERLPRQPRDAVYSYLSRLRVVLAGARDVELARRSGGYVLRTDPACIDLHRFRALVADSAGQPDQVRADLLAQALGLWSGEALTGVDSAWATAVREALEGEQLAVRLDDHDVRLRLGRHAELVAPLSTLAAARPLDERVAHQLIEALASSGRQAQALAHYETLRRHLVDELGVDPSQELRELHRRLLSPAEAPSRDVPRQLPLAPAHFQGRVHELDALSAGHTVLITAIRGAGGIGKTWLALHWAHGHAGEFPDGQLYVNLRGFDPTAAPTAPAVVLRGFLTSLGTAPDSLPDDVDTLAAMYRSAVADRRMLVVLDNAADTAQVEPLLPGTASCRTLVTSRQPLTGLVATHGAVPMPLDVLTDDEAFELLTARLGAREPEAMADIVRHCGGLPLALGIVAARAAVRTNLRLAEIAAELRSARLDALDTGDLSLRATISWSHRALSTPASVLFGLVGLAPAVDLSVAALDALAAADSSAAVAELEAAHLVVRTGPGHYRMHDLIHLYASEQPVSGGEAALTRLVDLYLHTAHIGERLLEPDRPPYDLPDPAPGVVPVPLADKQSALAWFDAEHAMVLAVQRIAADHGWHRRVWALASTTTSYHWQQGHRAEPLQVLRLAVAAAKSAGEQSITARLLHTLGHMCARAGLNTEALAHLEESAATSAALGDPLSEGHAQLVLARVWGQQGDYRRAKQHARTGLELYRASGEPGVEALALNNLGWICANLGEYEEALAHCAAAVPIHRAAGRWAGVGETLDSIGYIHEQRGAPAEAAVAYRESADMFWKVGHHFEAAVTLERLGGVLAAEGDRTGARQAWTQALEVFRGRGLAEADALEQRLASL
ncbi:BTAD domain-containing putative transcriptional regulator [Lentzea sp. NPDC042327]|uniref:AfsR/SARP family transcriptional regulator n=1 Tax=Lentzea sp. NPDC042327 TaxID=3154801 RepID=UPI0033C9AADC